MEKNVALGLLTWDNLKINFCHKHCILLHRLQNGVFIPSVQLVLLYYILYYIILLCFTLLYFTLQHIT
jgi:hypothetical protein